MSIVHSIEAVVAASQSGPHIRFESNLDRGMTALAHQLSSTKDATNVDAIASAPEPFAVFSKKMVTGLKQGFVADESAQISRLLSASQDSAKSIDPTQLMLATHKCQMAAALSTAVQTMSSNVKQAVDKLITAS